MNTVYVENRQESYARFVESRVKPLQDAVQDRLHAAVGISGEAGELLDAIKKNWIYGKPLDYKNVLEELGDLRFYMQALQNLCGFTDQEVLQANADKLIKRYPVQYTDVAAIARADKQGE